MKNSSKTGEVGNQDNSLSRILEDQLYRETSSAMTIARWVVSTRPTLSRRGPIHGYDTLRGRYPFGALVDYFSPKRYGVARDRETGEGYR